MSSTNRDGLSGGGEPATERMESWYLGHDELWAWVVEALDGVAAATIDVATLRALCLRVLDTHAPAALVHAQAAGLALERLVPGRLTAVYADRHGLRPGHYDVRRLRAIARHLCAGAAAR